MLGETAGAAGNLPPKPTWQEQDVPLPRAVLEWAASGGADIMDRHSNLDMHWFGPGGHRDVPEIVSVAEDVRGLVFEREHQSNYAKAVALGLGDDPPVFYRWWRGGPWIVHCLRFSDSVFAHVFDYQYAYDNRPGPDEVERYTGAVRLRDASSGLDLLRQRYPETVTTWGVFDDWPFAQYRFSKSQAERMTVYVGADHGKRGEPAGAIILVTGATDDLATALEAELCNEFAGQVLPLTFSSLQHALSDLERHLRGGMIDRLRWSCARPPTAEAVEALIAAWRSQPLVSLAKGLGFPKSGRELAVGGTGCGVTIRFQHSCGDWWRLEAIEA